MARTINEASAALFRVAGDSVVRHRTSGRIIRISVSGTF
jgi:hypothetical protein